jgi:hypothetical protein
MSGGLCMGDNRFTGFYTWDIPPLFPTSYSEIPSVDSVRTNLSPLLIVIEGII